jgi:hypothetical protein
MVLATFALTVKGDLDNAEHHRLMREHAAVTIGLARIMHQTHAQAA